MKALPSSETLSPGFVKRLKPAFQKAYFDIPAALRRRTAHFVARAGKTTIDPTRLLQFALLRAVVENQFQGDAVGAEQTRQARAETKGKLHGFNRGYRDPATAEKLYQSGRRASQRIDASLTGLLKRWDNCLKVIQTNRSKLPTHLQRRLSDENLASLRLARRTLTDVQRHVAADTLEPKRRESQLTEELQTILLWDQVVPPYKQKMGDMHQLSNIWGLSGARKRATFRAILIRLRSRGKTFRSPVGTRPFSMFAEET